MIQGPANAGAAAAAMATVAAVRRRRAPTTRQRAPRALALLLLAVALAFSCRASSAQDAGSIDLRPQAAEYARAALAEFEAQDAERAKDEAPYIQTPGGGGGGGGGEDEGEAGAADEAVASVATPVAAAAVPAAATATPTTTTASAPTMPQPRAMAIALGTAQKAAGAAAGADANAAPSADAPPPPSDGPAMRPPAPDPVFPAEFPPTPSAQACASSLASYRAFMSREPAPFDGPRGQSLVYFLHVPRTAGRTFHVCLLRQATPPDRRCPKSYDHLRVDVSLPKCHLLSSHDDFSVVEKLPAQTSAVTQLRDPVDRFLSAYEFAAEVAARSVLKTDPLRRPETNKTITEDVWPWSLLVPWFVGESKKRIEAVDAAADAREAQEAAAGGSWIAIPAPDGRDFYYNAALNVSSWDLAPEQRGRLLPPLDPYDNPLIPSLSEFARSPVARELLHEGQALQILGLTNYSHWGPAPALRACLFGREDVRRELLEVAERRLARFTHVGSTGRLRESVEAAAALLGAPLSGAAFSPGNEDAAAAGSSDAGPSALASGNATFTPVTSVAHPRVAELAAAARRAQGRARRAEERWNGAVARTRQGLLPIGADPRAEPVAAAQPELRLLKGVLNRARAEVQAAQGALVRQRRALRAEGWRPGAQGAAMPALADGTSAAPPAAGALSPGAASGRDRSRLDAALGGEFERCARRAQAKNLERRERSLINLMMPDGRTVRFTKDARGRIPPAVLAEIRALSPLDDALHKLAERALDERRERLRQEGRLLAMPDGPIDPKAAREARPPSRWAKVFPLPPGERGGGGGGGGGGSGSEL